MSFVFRRPPRPTPVSNPANSRSRLDIALIRVNNAKRVHGVNATIQPSPSAGLLKSPELHTCKPQARSVYVNQHGRLMRGILLAIEADQQVSQRRLSSRLGIALGLTNLLLRRVIAKGWVKVVHVQRNRVGYLVTPAGLAAKARLTREYLDGTLKFYAEARERVRERFEELSADLARENQPKRIVFFGGGEIAEIG